MVQLIRHYRNGPFLPSIAHSNSNGFVFEWVCVCVSAIKNPPLIGCMHWLQSCVHLVNPINDIQSIFSTFIHMQSMPTRLRTRGFILFRNICKIWNSKLIHDKIMHFIWFVHMHFVARFMWCVRFWRRFLTIIHETNEWSEWLNANIEILMCFSRLARNACEWCGAHLNYCLFRS